MIARPLTNGFVQWIHDTKRECPIDDIVPNVILMPKSEFNALVNEKALCDGPYCDPPNHRTYRPYLPPEKDNRMAWGVRATDKVVVCAWIQGEECEQ